MGEPCIPRATEDGFYTAKELLDYNKKVVLLTPRKNTVKIKDFIRAHKLEDRHPLGTTLGYLSLIKNSDIYLGTYPFGRIDDSTGSRMRKKPLLLLSYFPAIVCGQFA